MYKRLAILCFMLASAALQAQPSSTTVEPSPLDAEQLKAKVVEITQAQNRVMMVDAGIADVDRLFSLYTEDFEYVHAVYGGTYTRQQLYANTVALVQGQRYGRTTDRYRIVSMIPGYNGIAVERQEVHEGKSANHLAVFEFRGEQVSKIVEYWK